MSSLSWGYALHLVVWKLFILRVFSACFRLSTSSRFPPRVFLMFWGWGSSRFDDIFCFERGEFSQVDLLQRFDDNEYGKSAASFFDFDSDKFLLVYMLEDATSDVIFHWSCASLRRSICVGMYQGGNPFALVETGIHDQYTRDRSRFSSPYQLQVFSKHYSLPCNLAVVKFLFSHRNWPSATAFKQLKNKCSAEFAAGADLKIRPG